MNFAPSLVIIVLFIFVVWYMAQTRFKSKMLCYFIRPNRQRIKKWVPISDTWVIFNAGRGKEKEQYYCDPECITLEWYDGGINRFFPVLIPTLEFRWDTAFPLDPKKFETTWQKPQVVNAAWEAHQHMAFAKGTQSQVSVKGKSPELIFSAITIVIVVVLGYLVFQLMNQVSVLEQTVRYSQ